MYQLVFVSFFYLYATRWSHILVTLVSTFKRDSPVKIYDFNYSFVLFIFYTFFFKIKLATFSKKIHVYHSLIKNSYIHLFVDR